MLYLPPDPKPGDPVRADTITAILKYLRQITPRTSATCDVQVGAGGATFRPIFPRWLAALLSPGVLPLALQPGSDVSTNSAARHTITYGTYGGGVPTIDGTPLSPVTASNMITFGASDTCCYMQCDFTYDSYGNVTITDAEIKTTSGSVPTSTISGGSGTVYQQLFGVAITAPVGGGPYTIVAAPAVGGSQNFGVCGAGSSITGPWGV